MSTDRTNNVFHGALAAASAPARAEGASAEADGFGRKCTAAPSKDHEAGVLNVLDLGVCNDGSKDISSIVNQYAADHALFFPAGVYKVSSPINAKHSLYGVGYAREPKPDSTRTWFVSEIENDGKDIARETGVVNVCGDRDTTVSGINILCHSHECGILIDPCRHFFLVERLGIFNVRGYGILAKKSGDVPGFSSRPLFLDDLTIWGTRDYPAPSVGIYIGGRIGDNRLSNIEIMGTRVGVYQGASFVYADNMHIWTGTLAGHDNGTWWETTRGLVLGRADASFMGSNIYIDTAFALVEFTSKKNCLSISNFVSWDDQTSRGSSRYDARAFLVPEGMEEMPDITLSGGLLFVAGNDENPGRTASLTAPGPNPRIENVRILTDYSVCRANFRRLSFLEKDTPRYRMQTAAPDEVREVLVAAVVAEAADGTCAFTCATDTGAFARVRVERTKGATDVVFEERRRGDIFRADVTDGFVKIFAAAMPGQAFACDVDTAYATRLCFPLDLGILKRHVDYAPHREIR